MIPAFYTLPQSETRICEQLGNGYPATWGSEVYDKSIVTSGKKHDHVFCKYFAIKDSTLGLGKALYPAEEYMLSHIVSLESMLSALVTQGTKVMTLSCTSLPWVPAQAPASYLFRTCNPQLSCQRQVLQQAQSLMVSCILRRCIKKNSTSLHHLTTITLSHSENHEATSLHHHQPASQPSISFRLPDPRPQIPRRPSLHRLPSRALLVLQPIPQAEPLLPLPRGSQRHSQSGDPSTYPTRSWKRLS
jgi:hypothetical protein